MLNLIIIMVLVQLPGQPAKPLPKPRFYKPETDERTYNYSKQALPEGLITIPPYLDNARTPKSPRQEQAHPHGYWDADNKVRLSTRVKFILMPSVYGSQREPLYDTNPFRYWRGLQYVDEMPTTERKFGIEEDSTIPEVDFNEKSLYVWKFPKRGEGGHK